MRSEKLTALELICGTVLCAVAAWASLRAGYAVGKADAEPLPECPNTLPVIDRMAVAIEYQCEDCISMSADGILFVELDSEGVEMLEFHVLANPTHVITAKVRFDPKPIDALVASLVE